MNVGALLYEPWFQVVVIVGATFIPGGLVLLVGNWLEGRKRRRLRASMFTNPRITITVDASKARRQIKQAAKAVARLKRRTRDR
jgi:hypothetical protein